MPKPSRPFLGDENPVDAHSGTMAALLLLVFFLGLALLVTVDRGNQPQPACWHGMEIGSDRSCR